MQTLEAAATGTNWGTASVTAPSATLSSTGTVSAMGGASLRAPMATLVGYSGAVCSVTLTGKAQLQASEHQLAQALALKDAAEIGKDQFEAAMIRLD
jgi:hypothetical protein